jgi:hypothetical protein
VAESDERSGRSSSSRDDEVTVKLHDLVRADRRISIRGVAEQQRITCGSCKGILTQIWV